VEICPPRPLASMALGSRVAALNHDYHLGRRSGRYFLATLGQWLSDAEPARRSLPIAPPAAAANAPDARPLHTPPLAGNDAAWDEGSLA